MDYVIKVEGIKCRATHGVYPEERIFGADFLVNVSVKAALDEVLLEQDELSGTVDYGRLLAIVEKVMAQPTALLEKLVLLIATDIQKLDQRITGVTVEVIKLKPPLPGEVGATSVTVTV